MVKYAIGALQPGFSWGHGYIAQDRHGRGGLAGKKHSHRYGLQPTKQQNCHLDGWKPPAGRRAGKARVKGRIRPGWTNKVSWKANCIGV